MTPWLPSIPYPPKGQETGYWSPVTSTLNWCEEDYYATHYIAELINSLTNLWFVYLGYKGIRNCLRNNHDQIWLYAFILYLLIGLNSLAFHATLKYTAQLGDELAMIYTTCVMFFALFAHRRSAMVKVVVGLVAGCVAGGVTGWYLVVGDPKFHQRAFAALTATVFFRSVYLMERTLRGGRSGVVNRVKGGSGGKNESESDVVRAKREQRDRQILSTMYALISIGMGSMLFGFFIWNLDNKFCGQIRAWRRSMGLPWGFLLEGHGWWHFFTGIAGYYNIVRSVWLRYCIEGKQDQVELIWPSVFVMPSVEHRGTRVKSN